MRKPRDIDEYLAGVGLEQRELLAGLRRTIRSVLPDAEECISYGIPAFRLGGRVVAGFCARTSGCSYFPFSGSTLRTLRARLAGYEQTRSSLHFERTLPRSLVAALIAARVAEETPVPRRRGRASR